MDSHTAVPSLPTKPVPSLYRSLAALPLLLVGVDHPCIPPPGAGVDTSHTHESIGSRGIYTSIPPGS